MNLQDLPKDSIIFISDLHIGIETFSHEKTLSNILNWARHNPYGTLVILGDLLEHYNYRSEDVWENNKDLIEEIFASPAKFIVGNHDLIPNFLYNIQKKLPVNQVELSSNYLNSNWGIFAEHGHAYDPFNKESKLWLLNLAEFKQKLLDVFGDSLKRPLEYLEDWMVAREVMAYLGYRQEHKKFLIPSSARESLKLVKELLAVKTARGKADINILAAERFLNLEYHKDEVTLLRQAFRDVATAIAHDNSKLFAGWRDRQKYIILGHTHQPDKVNLNKDITYLNTGSWVSSHFPPTIAAFYKKENSGEGSGICAEVLSINEQGELDALDLPSL